MILALALLLALPAAAARFAPCTRAHDREIQHVLPAAVHARLAALPGAHARRAAAYIVGDSTNTLKIGVRASQGDEHPKLRLMTDNSLMMFMTGKGYLLEHSILHEVRGGERAIARSPARMAELADLLLPIWVHEISHARVHHRDVRWPISATLEDEMIACFTQAVFTAELLAVEPRYAGLASAYRAERAARKSGGTSSSSPTKASIIESLEMAAASTQEFERLFRRAYSIKSSLADPLTAGLRRTQSRSELRLMLLDLKLPPSQKASADELLDYGKEDDAFWLDTKAPTAASRDAERELIALRAELDAARPALRAWFEAAAGERVDWAGLAPPRDVPVSVAPDDGRR